jgi:nucleoside-triphosphatase
MNRTRYYSKAYVMNFRNKNIVITGIPGVGKTTLVKKLLAQLRQLSAAGFYTDEIRESGIRKGFELVDLLGNRSLLSHIGIKSPFRVGKYYVDVMGFDKFLDNVEFLNPQTGLVVVDEVGKMECYSDKFASIMRMILDSDKTVIATIAQKGGGLIAEIKERTDIQLFVLTLENRDRIAFEILNVIPV